LVTFLLLDQSVVRLWHRIAICVRFDSKFFGSDADHADMIVFFIYQIFSRICGSDILVIFATTFTAITIS